MVRFAPAVAQTRHRHREAYPLPRPVRRQSARVVSRLSLSADNPDGVPQPHHREVQVQRRMVQERVCRPHSLRAMRSAM